MRSQQFFSMLSTVVLSQSVWVEVPETKESSLDNQQPWYIDKTIERNSNKVKFVAFSSSSEYLVFEGNCKKTTLRVLFLGQFNNENKIEYLTVPHKLWHWHKAKDVERKVLEYVCSTGSG